MVLAIGSAFAGRVVNTTLSLPENPASDRYVLEPLPQLDALWGMSGKTPPGESNRLFVLDKSGVIHVFPDLSAPIPPHHWFLDLREVVDNDAESGLVGLAFHPGYATNRQFYVYYALKNSDGSLAGQRLSRFLTDPTDPNLAQRDSEVPLFTQADPDVNHNGGDLKFGPDGFLYVSLGDGGGGHDNFQNSQRIDRDLFSGILRLDVDQRSDSLPPNPHPSVHEGTYRIPADNPFVGVTEFAGRPVEPSEVRTEYYAVGLRNPFRMSFDSATGDLWANDVGQDRREEINLIRPGGNYGWSAFEGSIQWRIPAGVTDFEGPVFEYEHEQGRLAITASLFCRGARLSELNGGYLFADLTGDIGLLRRDGGVTNVTWIARLGPVIDFLQMPGSGEILIFGAANGQIYRLDRRRVDGPPIPPRLSETGIFADLATLQPNPGIEPFEVNVPFWSDGAVKRRWFSLPRPDQRFDPSAFDSWQAPAGAVWIKHFDLPPEVTGPTGRRRIETRVLVKNAGGIWGATYRWNEAETDASLVPPDGADEFIPVTGGTQRWRYPSQAECLACHNSTGGPLLGFNTAQLNREVLREGKSVNQLKWLEEAGYLTRPLPHPEVLPRLAASEDAQWPRSYRVRSYLAANCSYCHLGEGVTRAYWDGRLTQSLTETRLAEGLIALTPVGDYSHSRKTYLVAPGEPEASAIHIRLNRMDSYHMPPLGTFVRNEAAVSLLANWITNDLPARISYSGFQKTRLAAVPAEQAVAEADPDGDGLSNDLERLLGEDPLNPLRKWTPQLVSVDGAWKLRFPRLAGLRFEVQWTPALADQAWVTVDDPANRWVFGLTDEEAIVPLPFGVNGGFCRIMIQEP